MATEPLNIDDLKARLQAVKSRADAILVKKDDLIRQTAQNEEQQQQAIRELEGLGYPEAAQLDLQGLEDLTTTLTQQLSEGIAALEVATVETEKLLGMAKATDSLDL